METAVIKGIGVSRGSELAPAAVLRRKELTIPQDQGFEPAEERSSFLKALEKVVENTVRLGQEAQETLGESNAAVFEAHCMMLQDPVLADTIMAAIDEGYHAAKAIELGFGQQIDVLEAMDDEYFRERAADLRDLTQRMVNAVMGEENVFRLRQPSIVVAEDLAPSETAQLDRKLLLGIVTQDGGKTSHTAILARALGIPAIVGCRNVFSLIDDGETIAIDADKGEVYLHPSDELAKNIERLKNDAFREQQALELFRHGPTRTRDGTEVELFGNIGSPADYENVQRQGGEGVGLFRSEFLYLERNDLPDEEEQKEAYASVLEAADGKTVIVRTLDIGGDKQLPALDLPAEDNPFLGCRAIRLCFEHPELFRTQLRALLRASTSGSLRIMFPMISSLFELRKAKEMLEQCRLELEWEGVAVSADIKVGMMVEIPAAAVLADVFAGEVDFFSIGTNDLIQYTVAADRGNRRVESIYSFCQPAVLRLIGITTRAAHAHRIPCGMCGEMAGDIRMTPLLLGLGLDELSMNPSMIPRVRRRIAELELSECQKLAEAVLKAGSIREVEELLNIE